MKVAASIPPLSTDVSAADEDEDSIEMLPLRLPSMNEDRRRVQKCSDDGESSEPELSREILRALLRSALLCLLTHIFAVVLLVHAMLSGTTS